MTTVTLLAQSKPPPPPNPGEQGWVLRMMSETHQGVVDTNRELHNAKVNQDWLLLLVAVVIGWLIVLTLKVWRPMGLLLKSYEEHETIKQDHQTVLKLVRGYFGLAAVKESKAVETLETVKAQTKDAVNTIRNVTETVRQVIGGKDDLDHPPEQPPE